MRLEYDGDEAEIAYVNFLNSNSPLAINFAFLAVRCISEVRSSPARFRLEVDSALLLTALTPLECVTVLIVENVSSAVSLRA